MSDTAKVFGTTYTGVTALKVSDGNSGTLTYIRPQGTKSITENGTGIDVSSYESVNVNVSGGGGGGDATLITKSITTNGTYDAEDDSADGYSSVTVTVPTGTARTSSDLTASGDTVTVPAGLYAEAATKSVASGSATTPTTTISVTPGISVSSAGLITATASGSQSVTPTVSAGYISAGTAGTITVSGSNTSQLSTQAAATITPTESAQTAVAAGKYTTGAVTVGAISSTYVGSGITRRSSTDLTASGDTITVPAGYYATAASKSVASGTAGTPTATKGTVSNHQVSITPSVTNTTGYITGSTINGTAVTVTASELASGNKAIVDNGTNIDVVGYSTVSVAVPFSTITTSSSNPTGGSNGDIWIKVVS